MRRLILWLGTPLAVLPVLAGGAARAQSAQDLPVVNVNNEIGLAADMMLQNNFDKELPGNTSPIASGWLPGLEAKASVMQDVLGISNVYAAVRYTFNDGAASLGPFPPYGGTVNQISNELNIEVGKGFLLTNDFMLIPFIQGGYDSLQTSENFGGQYTNGTTNGYIGVGLRADYALTPRLVLTGRLGWAETVDGNISIGPTNVNRSLGDMPAWQAGAGFDYLMTGHWHLYGGVDYTDFALAGGEPAMPPIGAATSKFSDLNFHLGIAWSF